jgi:hypothetical protein
MLIAAIALVIAPLGAQAQETPEQLRKMYDDALAQLKIAQERRNTLALENERLAAQVNQLQTQLDQARAQLDELRRAAAQWADRTFQLRAHYAAWNRFIARYPRLQQQWILFMDADILSVPAGLPELLEPRALLSGGDAPASQESDYERNTIDLP